MDRFEKWQPVQSIPSGLCVEAIHDDDEGFRILLRGERKASKILRLRFDPTLAYRATDESSLINYDRTDDGTLDRYGLFIVHDSEYLAWFAKVNQGVSGSVTHYAVYLSNQCIDVIAAFPPDADWL